MDAFSTGQNEWGQDQLGTVPPSWRCSPPSPIHRFESRGAARPLTSAISLAAHIAHIRHMRRAVSSDLYYVSTAQASPGVAWLIQAWLIPSTAANVRSRSDTLSNRRLSVERNHDTMPRLAR